MNGYDEEVSYIWTVRNKTVTTRSRKGEQEWIGRLDLQETWTRDRSIYQGKSENENILSFFKNLENIGVDGKRLAFRCWLQTSMERNHLPAQRKQSLR